MGTETIKNPNDVVITKIPEVKLNNPLMGTETL